MGKRDAPESGAGLPEGKKKKKRALAAEVECEERAEVELEPELAKTEKKKKKRTKIMEAEPEELPTVTKAEKKEPEPAQIKKKKKSKHPHREWAAEVPQVVEPAQEVESTPAATAAKEKVTDQAPKRTEEQRAADRAAINNDFRVFVSGIPRTVDEATLRKDFEECGEIANCKLMLDGQTWQSRGIAFITFKTESGVNAAIEYDGDEYGGRRLSVKRAEAKGAGKGSGHGPKPEGCNSVVLKSLSPDATEEDIKEMFSSTHFEKVGLLMDKHSGKSRCTARIDYKDGHGVDEAMKLSSGTLRGRPLFMDYCKPREW